MLSSFPRPLALAFLIAIGVSACGGEKPQNGNGQSSPAASAKAPAPVSDALYVAGAEKDAQAVGEILKKKYPTLTVSEIKRLNISGDMPMFEFLAGGQVAYTNKTVDFLLVGGEMLTGAGDQAVNLTEKSVATKMADAFQKIPTEGALKYVYGDGTRKVVIFSDPDCQFCQALEFMLYTNKDNLNATVTIVPYPIVSLHPQAEQRSQYLLCAQDPEKSWRDWMLTAAAAVGKGEVASWDQWAAKNPSSPGCDRAKLVEKVKQYGLDYGFNQTPILMFSNGMPFLGLIERTELEKAWEFVRTGTPPVQ